MAPRVIAALAALFVVSGVVHAQPAPVGEPRPIVIGQSFALPSKILGEDRRINVYLPPDYGKDQRRYPVLYLIDGGEAQDFHHISGLAQLAWVSGAHRELVVIGVETVDRRKELTARATSDPRYAAEWPTHGQSARFRAFLAQEVIPFAEGRYRLSGESAVMGESLAGLFVVETFLREPGLFDRYVAISPSLWWDGQALAKAAPALLAAQEPAERTLWLASADEGGAMQAGMDRLVAALKAAPPKGLAWSHSPRPGETHASIYHGAALDALRGLYGIDTRPDPATPAPWWLN